MKIFIFYILLNKFSLRKPTRSIDCIFLTLQVVKVKSKFLELKSEEMGRKLILSVFIASILLVSTIASPLTSFAQSPKFIPGETQIMAVSGIVPGKDLIVHVVFAAPHDTDKAKAAIDALAKQGARPFTSEEYSFTGLVWDQFGDSDSTNDYVTQYYNSKNVPANIGDAGRQALINSHLTWSGVSTSNFSIVLEGDTNRCPSLVLECKGPQKYDDENGVGWLRLNDPNTLGVTWSSTSRVEADVALNTQFPWSADGVNDIDVETVIVHENGHVAGLRHSTVEGAIMEPVYDGVRQSLSQDDKDGITVLYPNLTINSRTLDGISISPENGDVDVGSSIQFALTEDYSDGTHDAITDPVTWASSNTTAASINSITGLAQGVVAGSTTITAYYDGIQYSTSLTINSAPETPQPGSLVTEIFSSQKQKGPNTDVSFTVEVTDEDGAVSDIQVNFDITRTGKEFHFLGVTDSSGSVKFTVMKSFSDTCYTGIIINWSSFDPNGVESVINCTAP